MIGEEVDCFCQKKVVNKPISCHGLARLVDFLLQFEYLYKHPNIRFLADNHWKNVPLEWFIYLDGLQYDIFNRLPFVDVETLLQCPLSLKRFLAEAKNVSHLPLFKSCCLDSCYGDVAVGSQINNSRVKLKKKHELEEFISLLKKYCTRYGVTRIIDVGCGVGHLLHCVSDQFIVIGLECNESLCLNGKKRYDLSSIHLDKINYLNLRLNSESAEKLEVLEFFEGQEKDRTAVVCLHGCGDLQITLFKLFKRLNRVKVPLLFSVPCCYHKLSCLDLPVSEWCLSNALKSCCPTSWNLTRSALRLACQQQICSWPCNQEIRRKHTKDFLTRALLECVNDVADIIPSNAPRRLTRSLKDIDSVITLISKRMNFSAEFTSELANIYSNIIEQKKQYFQFIESYTMIQSLLQKPLESLILWDRLYFLLESGVSTSLEMIFNPLISPRNYCIIGYPKQK